MALVEINFSNFYFNNTIELIIYYTAVPCYKMFNYNLQYYNTMYTNK